MDNLLSTISQNDRIDHVTALHASEDLPIELPRLLQRVKALLDDHETPTA
jgi:hypothetical protein